MKQFFQFYANQTKNQKMEIDLKLQPEQVSNEEDDDDDLTPDTEIETQPQTNNQNQIHFDNQKVSFYLLFSPSSCMKKDSIKWLFGAV